MRWAVLLGLVVAFSAAAQNSDETMSKTTLGQRNPNLADGAQALMDGDAEMGIRLTHLGLTVANSERERKAAHSNLCAGYLMLEQLDTALRHCNWVLERDDRQWRTLNNRALVYIALERYEDARIDIERGQELAPNSEKLKEVKGRYRDAVEPVIEAITIDDRRPADREDEP